MGRVSLDWPGGRHEFHLPIGQLRAVQKNCNAGPEEVFNRLRSGSWQVDDVIQVLRFGLAGSGEMNAAESADLIMSIIDLHPLVEFKITAIAVLAAALLGVEDDPVGEEGGVMETPPENGGSPSSTAQGL